VRDLDLAKLGSRGDGAKEVCSGRTGEVSGLGALFVGDCELRGDLLGYGS
jgi:hypothetical protein